MKKNKLNLALLLISAMVFKSVAAQEIFTDQKAAEQFEGAKMVRSSQHSNLPSYIKLDKAHYIPEAQLANWMKSELGLNAEMGFQVLSTEKDKIGFTHVRLEQTWKGYPIEASTWISHSKNNLVQSMNGLIFKTLDCPATPTITKTEALEKAKLFVGASQYKWELPEEEAHLKWESGDPNATYFPKGELVFAPKNFSLKPSDYRLAYKFNIYAQQPLYRAYVFVDAITGEIIGENSILHHADTPGTAVTAYSGSKPIIADSFGGSFRLRDGSRGLGIRTFDLNNAYGYVGAVDFVDDDNIWDNVNPQQDEYAGDAHWGTEMCYDYYNDVHGRNSIDGAGYQLNSYIHYGVNYVNAFWDGSRMTYGDGNGAPYTPLTSIDIAGHELTHGLTNFTANLIYSAESGALNESFSDIFGTAIENYARPGDWDWLMSDDIGAPFRSLSNPNLFGHPDTYFGTNWASLFGGDNGGVHTNSGVQNFWYYLLVSGGTGTNDNGDAYSVTGIDFASASAIAFRNLTVYLTPGSDHADARFFAIQSAIDLFGECSIEEEATTNAWYAVGVGPEYVSSVTADFTATIACFPDGTVDFTDASVAGVGVLDTWSWDFGDGDTSPDTNPTHAYAGTGTYPVSLTVTNDLGCESIFVFDVNVFDAPEVDFTYSNLCEGDLTEFTDATTIPSGVITNWDWDFGDLTTSMLADPTHSFGAFGTFDVKLVATSDNGCKDSLTLPINIASSPVVDFSFDDDCYNLDALFTNLTTIPDGGTIATYNWDFGDASPPDITESPTHLYASPGAYDVTLDIVSDAGCTNSVTYTINRFDIPEANFSVDDICEDNDATFTDLSIITAPDVITDFDWVFGDGGTGTGAPATYLYATSGTFDVTLTVTSSNGCVDNITLPINVNPNPVANFSAANKCVNEGPSFFTDMSTLSGGAITGWNWNFDDGTFAGVADPIKNYSTPGTYDVTLTVTTDFGCTNTITLPYTVLEKPNAQFSVPFTQLCSEDCVDFNDLSFSATTAITSWKWDFGDGNTSTNQHPKACFEAPHSNELFDISLIVTNSVGCKDTVTHYNFIEAYPNPIASFIVNPNEIDIFDPSIQLINTTENGYNYSWDFGDHTANSSDFEPNHTYPDGPGTYRIILKAESENGLCISFAEQTVTVKDIVIYYIPNSFTPDGDTYNQLFAPVFQSGYDPYDFHFQIFNRWGELVFETYNALYGWDGTYGGLGLAESGTYVWTLDFSETQTDKRHSEMGHVTLIR